MPWRRPCEKPLSEPLVVSLLRHICVIQAQGVNYDRYIYEWISQMRFKPAHGFLIPVSFCTNAPEAASITIQQVISEIHRDSFTLWMGAFDSWEQLSNATYFNGIRWIMLKLQAYCYHLSCNAMVYIYIYIYWQKRYQSRDTLSVSVSRLIKMITIATFQYTF